MVVGYTMSGVEDGYQGVEERGLTAGTHRSSTRAFMGLCARWSGLMVRAQEQGQGELSMSSSRQRSECAHNKSDSDRRPD